MEGERGKREEEIRKRRGRGKEEEGTAREDKDM